MNAIVAFFSAVSISIMCQNLFSQIEAKSKVLTFVALFKQIIYYASLTNLMAERNKK